VDARSQPSPPGDVGSKTRRLVEQSPAVHSPPIGSCMLAAMTNFRSGSPTPWFLTHVIMTRFAVAWET